MIESGVSCVWRTSHLDVVMTMLSTLQGRTLLVMLIPAVLRVCLGFAVVPRVWNASSELKQRRAWSFRTVLSPCLHSLCLVCREDISVWKVTCGVSIDRQRCGVFGSLWDWSRGVAIGAGHVAWVWGDFPTHGYSVGSSISVADNEMWRTPSCSRVPCSWIMDRMDGLPCDDVTRMSPYLWWSLWCSLCTLRKTSPTSSWCEWIFFSPPLLMI